MVRVRIEQNFVRTMKEHFLIAIYDDLNYGRHHEKALHEFLTCATTHARANICVEIGLSITRTPSESI